MWNMLKRLYLSWRLRRAAERVRVIRRVATQSPPELQGVPLSMRTLPPLNDILHRELRQAESDCAYLLVRLSLARAEADLRDEERRDAEPQSQ
jgi:hypothetical protein